MNRMIRSVDGQKDLNNSLELVDTVFTESEGEEKGKSVIIAYTRSGKNRTAKTTHF